MRKSVLVLIACPVLLAAGCGSSSKSAASNPPPSASSAPPASPSSTPSPEASPSSTGLSAADACRTLLPQLKSADAALNNVGTNRQAAISAFATLDGYLTQSAATAPPELKTALENFDSDIVTTKKDLEAGQKPSASVLAALPTDGNKIDEICAANGVNTSS